MIQAEHLTKRYGAFTAIDDVSFHVKRGEVFALLGPNGSGKTTTMKTIVGLCVPTSGRVRIGDLDVRTHPKEARTQVSYLPQRVVFPESLTAREIIRFYGAMRKLPRELADRSLAEAKFNGASDKLVGEFSGGMVQRLGLAIVAMPDAPVLLLDEPTASLDPAATKAIEDIVRAVTARGVKVVMSTHDLGEAKRLAGDVVLQRLSADS